MKINCLQREHFQNINILLFYESDMLDLQEYSIFVSLCEYW